MSESRRILVGYDGSRASEAALAWAQATARASHARLSVVTVLGYPWYACGWPGMATAPAASELERGTCKILRDAVDGLAPDVSVTSRVVTGPVAAALAREARIQDCDLVVIGRGRRLLRPWRSRVERYLRRHLAVRLVVVTRPRRSEPSTTTEPALPATAAGVRPAI